MWVIKEIIPALIDAVETAIAESVAALDKEDWQREDGYDPNDLMILDGFVLNVLKENERHGFFATEMLDKGFSFMLGMVPAYLRAKRDELTPEVYGELARLHYVYQLKCALEYVQRMESGHFKSNIGNINRQVAYAHMALTWPPATD